MDVLTEALPVAPSDPGWDAAFLRVESYLRAHHIESRVLLNHLAAGIIRRARALAGDESPDEIIPQAMNVAQADVGQWFARIFPDGDWSDERFRARARLALLLADVPGRWSQHFLSPDPLPPELVEAMRNCTFQAGPELRFTNMPPTPIGSLLGEDSDPARDPGKRFPLVKTVLGGLVAAGLAGLAWAALQ
jgi:hypothetical protein